MVVVDYRTWACSALIITARSSKPGAIYTFHDVSQINYDFKDLLLHRRSTMTRSMWQKSAPPIQLAPHSSLSCPFTGGEILASERSSARKISTCNLSIVRPVGVEWGKTAGEQRYRGSPAGRGPIELPPKKLGLPCEQERPFKVTTNSPHFLPVKSSPRTSNAAARRRR
jgi:hypothetical protein